MTNRKILKLFYLRLLRYAKRPQALWLLLILACAESMFLPFPSMTIFVLVALAQHRNALWIALLVTIASVIGSFGGYVIGYFFWDKLGRLFMEHENVAIFFNKFDILAEEYGVLAIIIAATTPIPFKLAAIASGISGIHFIVFALASLIGRAIYFFIPATLIYFMGSHAKHLLEKHFYLIIIISIAIGLIIFLIMKVL